MDVKSKAKKFAKEFRLNSSKLLSFEELSRIAVKLNYKIYCTNDANDAVLKRLNICEFFQKYTGFSYHKGEIRYIFIHSDIPNEVAATVLLHELAHVYLGHLESSTIPAKSDESEANMFTEYVLKHAFGKAAKIAALGFATLILGVIMIITSVHLKAVENVGEANLTASAGTTIAEKEFDDQSEIVVVTKTGKKYHKSDCYHIIGSEVVELTISEAEAAGYKPCKDCF